jgi:putative ABC transport system permease protein
MHTGVSLAWLQLTRDKRRFMAALAGISFAVMLMLSQLGFEDALLMSSGLIHDRLKADLVLISPLYQFIINPRSFTDRRLYQALAVDGVQSVESLYLGQAPFKNPADGTERTIFVVAFKPDSALLDAPGIAENLDKIRKPGAVLFDSIRRPEFGPVAESFRENGTLATEVGGRRVDIAGLFQLGTSFGIDGTVVMSDETFLRVVPGRQLGIINVGLIRLKPGVDQQRVRSEIQTLMPADVRLMTRQEFVDFERNYWMVLTPTGFVFKLGVVMALLVGCIIVYQILYSDVTDHLPEYATMKAMGYPDLYLFKVVLRQSLILSIFGFVPGVFVANFLYSVSRDATNLPLRMTVTRLIAVYFLTVGMCGLSAALAMRRLKAADPADIF